jgi:hypothetical protein
LVRSLDRSGRTREACQRLEQVQAEHDVAAPDEDLLNRCRTQYRSRLNTDVQLAPQLRTIRPGVVQRTAPAQEVAPRTP